MRIANEFLMKKTGWWVDMRRGRKNSKIAGCEEEVPLLPPQLLMCSWSSNNSDWMLDSAENYKTTTNFHLILLSAFPLVRLSQKFANFSLFLSLSLTIYYDNFTLAIENMKNDFPLSVIISHSHNVDGVRSKFSSSLQEKSTSELSINFHFASRFETIEFVVGKTVFLRNRRKVFWVRTEENKKRENQFLPLRFSPHSVPLFTETINLLP